MGRGSRGPSGGGNRAHPGAARGGVRGSRKAAVVGRYFPSVSCRCEPSDDKRCGRRCSGPSHDRRNRLLRLIMMNHKLAAWCIIFVAHLIIGRTCFNVTVVAPRYADVGGQAVIRCLYSVDPEVLHKVEWLKGGRKLFQYVKGRTPPFRNYTTPGAVLDWKQSDEQQITLKDLDFEASGTYSCEVSTDTPIYTKPSEDHEMTVMQGQLEDPHISFGKPTYVVGEWLQVNCTSGPARPTPHVTWLINDRLAEEQLMKMFPEESPNSVTVQLGLEVEEKYLAGLRLTCVSTIPPYDGHHARHSPYADHREHSIKVEVIMQTHEPVAERQPNCGSGQKRLSLSHLLFSAVLLAVTAQ